MASKKTVKTKVRAKPKARAKPRVKPAARTSRVSVKKPVAFYKQPIAVLSNGVDRVFSFFK